MVELPSAVAVVLRSYNEAWALQDTLPMLARQEFSGRIELIVIDSGSSDGSPELIRAARPVVFREITPKEYVPGKVLNWGAAQAGAPVVVYLNADATPQDGRWLPELLLTLAAQARPGAVFGRQIPRPDCRGVYAHDYDRCFGPQRESAAWPHFFSLVSSATPKAVWAAHPFREDLQYAEDDEWSRRLKAAGLEVGFAEKSVAVHSHNYTPKQAYKRAYGDAKAMAATSTANPRHINVHNTVLRGWLRDVLRDWRWLAAHRRGGEVLHAARIRWEQRWGRWRGYHDGRQHYAQAPAQP